MFRLMILLALLAPAQPVAAQAASDSTPLQRSVAQLRGAVGHWAVTTEFLNEDGSVARSAEGTYDFAWVIPDRVVSGRSDIPALRRTAALLFYVSETAESIEMVSVGPDGRLWVMTGPLGGETRYTQEYPTPDGGKGQLRFTRYNVTADAFDSRMEYTTDGGTTWTPGNHQRFTRADSPDR